MENWSQVIGQIKNGSKASCPEEARGPLLEPGPEGGPTSERLVVGHATEPGRAQPEEATWLPQSPLFRPVGSPLMG